MTNSQSIDSQKVTGPELGVVDFELSPAAKRVLERALEREQWLSRIGLHGIVEGIAHHDMSVFGAACDRLLAHFRAAREGGRRDGRAELEPALRRARQLVGVALVAGVLLGFALGAFA